jgi:hypothetical protein
MIPVFGIASRCPFGAIALQHDWIHSLRRAIAFGLGLRVRGAIAGVFDE